MKIPPPTDPTERAAWERDLEILESDPRTAGKANRPPELVRLVLADHAVKAAKEARAAALDNVFETIARVHLGIATLQPAGHDSLDFHEVSVVSLRAALREVFEAGVKAGRNGD